VDASREYFHHAGSGGRHRFTAATLQEIPDINALLVRLSIRWRGIRIVVFNLDSAKALNLPLPDGFVSVSNLDDALRSAAWPRGTGGARAEGGRSSIVIYNWRMAM